MKKYNQKRPEKEKTEKAKLHLSKQLNSVYFLQLRLNKTNSEFMLMWAGGRAVQGRKDMPSSTEILLLKNLGNYTEPLIDAKEMPLNIKGKWRLHRKGF